MKAKIRWVKDEELWECSKCHAEVDDCDEECWNCGAVFVSESKSSGAPKLLTKIMIGVVAAVITFCILMYTNSSLLNMNYRNNSQANTNYEEQN